MDIIYSKIVLFLSKIQKKKIYIKLLGEEFGVFFYLNISILLLRERKNSGKFYGKKIN